MHPVISLLISFAALLLVYLVFLIRRLRGKRKEGAK